MGEPLKTSLSSLHSCLKLQDSARGGKATLIAKDIFGFSLDVSPQEVAYCSSLLFNEQNGLVKFLKLAVGLREFENVKADIQRFFVEFISSNSKRYTIDQLKNLKDQSLSMMICDQSVKVRTESINVISKIVTIGDFDESFGIKDLIENEKCHPFIDWFVM
eukprot:TCONS_00042863-protein